MEGLTDVLRLEMRGTGLEFILIEPGPIGTMIRQNSIPHFEKWIDWKHSARADEYQSLLGRLYESRGPDRFQLGPEAVTAKLIHALESQRPRARYYVTTPTYIAAWLKRLLPVRAQDWFLTKG